MQQAEILKEQLDLQKQQAGRERDRSLKVDHKLVKVGHNSLGQVPFEIMNLERQMQEENVKTWKDWYKYFLAALCEAARTWIEGAQTREPFRAIIQAARGVLADEQSWMRSYIQARWEVLCWCRADLFRPGDEAVKHWKAVRLTNTAPKAQEIYDFIEELNKARTWMIHTRMFKDDADSSEKEMVDLDDKIPLGGLLRFHMYGGQVRATSFDTWVNLLRTYAATLPQTIPQVVKLNKARFDDDGSKKQPPKQGDKGDVHLNRFGDYRNTSSTGGDRRPKAGSGYPRNSQQNAATRTALDKVPVCNICKGRHRATPRDRCRPNEIARERGYKFAGVKCDFNTRPEEVSCRGVGHSREDHLRFMKELTVMRSESKRFGHRPKGRSKGKQSRKGSGGKGKGKSSKGKQKGYRRPFYVRKQGGQRVKGRKLGVVAEGDEDQEDDFQDDGAESAGSWEEIDVDAYAEAVGHEEGDEDLEWDDPDEEYPLEQEEAQHGPAEAEQEADEEAEEYRDGEDQDYDEEEDGVEVPLQRATLHVSSDFPEADFDEASTFPSGVSVRAGRLRINAFRLRASGSQYDSLSPASLSSLSASSKFFSALSYSLKL